MNCEIRKFFGDNLGDFNAVLKDLRKIPEAQRDVETAKRIAALNMIIKKKIGRPTSKFSNKSQDETLCWACSDAIHAVLAPRGSSVVNRNGRHFDPICGSIGRNSLVYKSPKV
jgi:hypothetical protein